MTVGESAVSGTQRVAFAALFNIGFGLVAVAFTAMATRRLGIAEASEALVTWSVLTVLGAVTQQPAEIYAPRLAFEIRNSRAEPTELRRVITEIVTIGTAVSLCAVLVWGLGTGKSSSWYPGPVAVTIGFGGLYAHRSRLVGVGQFGTLTATAGVTGAVALTVSLLVVTAGFGSSTSDILLLTGVAFAVPITAELMDWRPIQNRPKIRDSQPRSVPMRSMLTTALSLSGTSALSLMLFAGGPPIGSILRMEPEILTSYAVTTSVASVPFIMMSSAMLPILNRTVELIEAGQWGRLLPMSVAAVGLASGGVLLVAAASGLLGPSILDAYIGGGFVLNRKEIVAVFVAAGMTAISNTPRLVITALGRAPSFNRWLAASVAVYMGTVFLTPDLPVFWRITSATFLAAGVLTIVGVLSVAQLVRDLGQSTREESSTA